MELSLKQDQIKCYESVLDTVTTQEETMEMIVPDACPDILQIVDTEGFVCIRGKEAKEGAAQIDGAVKTTVLYTPEGVGGVRRLSLQIPFFTKLEHASITPRTVLHVNPCVQSAETRMINPRKVLVRVQILLHICGFTPDTMELCTGVEAEEAAGLQTLSTQQSFWVVAGVSEKTFQFADSLPLSSGKPEAEEIMKFRTSIHTDDAKIIGTKMIFKGEVGLRVLYRSETGSLQTVDYTLPFSQMMEMNGVEESATCNLTVLLSDASVTLEASEDGSAFQVSMGFLAQAQVWEEKTVSLIADLYSTTHSAIPQAQNHMFHTSRERALAKHPCRETMETSVLPKMTLDAYVAMSQVTLSQDGEVKVFSANAQVMVLYQGEDNGIYQAELRVPVEERVAMSPEVACACSASCGGEVFASPVAGGIEVRFNVDFNYISMENQRVAGISNVTLEEGSESAGEDKPSVVLRLAEAGDRLWDLAKAYSSTVEDICAANELQEEDLSVCEGKLLLIPRKR